MELVEDRKGFAGAVAFKVYWVAVLDECGGKFFVEFLGCFVWVYGFGEFKLAKDCVDCLSEVVVGLGDDPLKCRGAGMQWNSGGL